MRTRPTTSPFGTERMFSPLGAVTTRSKPSRLVFSVERLKIHPSTTTSCQSPRVLFGSTDVPAGRETSAIPSGSFRSRVAVEISLTSCALRLGRKEQKDRDGAGW